MVLVFQPLNLEAYQKGIVLKCGGRMMPYILCQKLGCSGGCKLFYLFIYLCIYLFIYWFFETRSLCIVLAVLCPGTHSVDQAGLELRNRPASASQVLGLKACATNARLLFCCCCCCFLKMYLLFTSIGVLPD